jgi:hypothetical protein
MLLQFKLFDMHWIWKLYREFHSAFVSKAVSETEKAQARSFLMGHAVAMTALAGTLGLPFAGAMAAVVDKLKDELDPGDHPFNAIGAYRTFLASMFGKEVGEVIAKGVPNAVGFDLSSRIGGGDLLPLTQFLASRQTWSDTLQQWQSDAMGAPASMIADQLRALDQIHNGNVLGGMVTALPSGIRNPLRAYQMTERGYVDSNGTPLPLDSPNAGAILYQLLGLTPSAKAEYNDKLEIARQNKAALTRTQNMYQSKILRALQTGDTETAREAIRGAAQFDAENPAYAVLPRITQQLEARQRGLAYSGATGVPTGVNVKDFYTQGLTQF